MTKITFKRLNETQLQKTWDDLVLMTWILDKDFKEMTEDK